MPVRVESSHPMQILSSLFGACRMPVDVWRHRLDVSTSATSGNGLRGRRVLSDGTSAPSPLSSRCAVLRFLTWLKKSVMLLVRNVRRSSPYRDAGNTVEGSVSIADPCRRSTDPNSMTTGGTVNIPVARRRFPLPNHRTRSTAPKPVECSG